MMRRISIWMLAALLLLAGCSKPAEQTPPPEDVSRSVEEVDVSHEQEEVEEEDEGIPFQFTEENFPRLDGSTATIPLGQAVQSVLLGKPRAECEVSFSTTNHAYYNLLWGRVDLLLVYDGGEQTRLEVRADTNFDTAPIGMDGLVFLVNADNPVDNLTTKQLRGIFSGEIKNWSEVGGNDETILAYQRTPGSGSQALMDRLVMGDVAMGDPMTVPEVGSMEGLVDAVANYTGGANGIGYNVFFYVTRMYENPNIKIISIDGVSPSYETIQNGSYSFVSDFYAIIRKDEGEDSPARILYNWLRTKDAQELIRAENYVAKGVSDD